VRTRARTRIVTAVAIVIALVIGGCGLPTDDEPRTIPESDIPEELLAPSSTTTPEQPGAFTVTLWWIDDGLLAPRDGNVADFRIETAIAAVLAGPPPGDVGTSIPAGTTLLGIEEDDEDDVLVIDLSEQITGIGSPELDRALAQIVFTATEEDGVEGVQFQVNGEDLPVPTDAGVVSDPVQRNDFGALVPPEATTTTAAASG
jgi:spore germination protein GerM